MNLRGLEGHSRGPEIWSMTVSPFIPKGPLL